MTSLVTISQQLNENAFLADVCTSPNINKWSFFKPINNPTVTNIDRESLYSVNDGFELWISESPQDMLTDLEGGNLWDYNRCTQPPYRLTDFEGYDHSATELCNILWEGDNFGHIGDTLDCTCTDWQDIINNWDYFHNYTVIDLVFLIYEYGNPYTTQDLFLYKVTNYNNYSHLSITIPNLLTRGKRYNVIFCCTDATETWSDGECRQITQMGGNWWAFTPNCRLTMRVENN